MLIIQYPAHVCYYRKLAIQLTLSKMLAQGEAETTDDMKCEQDLII